MFKLLKHPLGLAKRLNEVKRKSGTSYLNIIQVETVTYKKDNKIDMLGGALYNFGKQ